MYGWVDDTDKWKGKATYDFGSARAAYDKKAKDAGATGSRSYRGTREPDMKLVDPRGKTLESLSTDPIVIGVDVTGSMSTWPREIFDRLPLLYKTLAKYRPNAEFAFAAIGDATCDQYPLQVTEFSKDIKGLEANLNALGCEGGGGGHVTESYELFGYFMLNHCKTPNATSPFLLIYGDEQFYEDVHANQVKHYIGDTLKTPTKADDVWRGLLQRFNLYHLHKPYGDGSSYDNGIKQRWQEALGKQRVIDLPSAERAVDIGMGLIAKHWGEYGDFSKSLDARHDDSTLKASVHRSLRHIDADPPTKSMMTKGKSVPKLPAPK